MAQLVVGLDIGTSAVRAAEIDISHSQPVLLTYGQVGLPPGSLVDGEIRDGSSVSEAIKKLWENGQFSTSTVIVGIAGLRAITRELDLPFVPDNEVDSAVRFQSEEVIPFPPDQTILSSQILADYTSPEGDKMRRVLVAAAHTDLVNGVIDTVEKAGLTVVGVDLISSALVRAIGGHEESEQPEAIVSVGAGLTVVVVHQNGRPQFVRTIGSGGNATTAAISGALDIPLSDAEGMKRRLGEESAQLQTAQRAAQASMAELVGEIRNSIQYFASLPGRLPVSRVLVTGGGSSLYGLLPMLEDQIHLPVLPVSPLARLNTSKLDLTAAQMNEVGPVLATPIGLALAEPDKTVKKFNLLPPEVAKRTRMKKIQERTLVGCVGVVVLLLAFGAWKFLQVHNAQNNVDTLQSQITTLNAQVPKYDLVVAANNAYTAGVAATGLGARLRHRLAGGLQQPGVHHPIGGRGPGVQRRLGIGDGHDRRHHRIDRRGIDWCVECHPVGGHRHRPTLGDRAGAEPLHLRGMDQRRVLVAAVRQPAAGCDDGQRQRDHLVPLHHLRHPQRQSLQECEPEMNEVREYRIPLLMGAATLVVALLVWAVLISPQNSKLSSLQTQQTTLQNQQTTLEAKLASLKSEQQKLSSSCADLQKIATQIPSVQSPTDVDAEESSFENQFNGLVAGSGVALTQFSGFAPATTAQATPSSGSSTAPAGVVAVPTTLAVTGNYGQISTFINDLDGFPRLFVIQSFVLTYGATSTAGYEFIVWIERLDGVLGRSPSPVDRGHAHGRRRRTVLAGHRRIDLLHVDPERPRRLHQGHRRRPLRPSGTGYPDGNNPRCRTQAGARAD